MAKPSSVASAMLNPSSVASAMLRITDALHASAGDPRRVVPDLLHVAADACLLQVAAASACRDRERAEAWQWAADQFNNSPLHSDQCRECARIAQALRS